MSERKPWERLTEESTRAYVYFEAYIQMNPTARSMEKVGKKYGKTLDAMERLAKKYTWTKRAEAWDDEQSRISREAHQKEIMDMRARHAKLAKKMIDKAYKAVDNMDPEEMNTAAVSKLVEVASKLERISRGDVGEVIEERDGGKVEPAVTFYMPNNNRDNKGD